jgi:23S rRNA pseudouridine1911/1915/1917 synthase
VLSSRVGADNFIVDTNFGVLYEDEHMLVLDKPAPLAVHPVGAYAELNLHSLLKKDPRWAGQSMRFVHRLDAETSGVICAAKTEEAARFLGIEFLNSRVEKTYHALVFGTPEKIQDDICIRLGKDSSSGFQTVRIADEKNGEEAVTRYRVLWSLGGYSWLEIKPLTGRTHQIRAHLKLIGHPIVGDKIYIDLNIFREYVIGGLNPEMLKRLFLPRLALHASHLRLRHPMTRDFMEFNSHAPSFMQEIPL